MTDKRDNNDASLKDADDLILEFLSGDLDRERMLDVRNRLEHDPAFRDLAAPIIYAWSVPLRPTKPVTRADAEKALQDLKQRAGIARRKPRNWRRMLRYVVRGLAVIVVLGGLTAAAYYPNRYAIEEWRFVRGMQEVPDTNGRITLADKTRIIVERGGKVRIHKSVVEGAPLRFIYLEGSAHVVVAPIDTATYFYREPKDYLVIITRGGQVKAHQGDFQIAARGDTTRVHVNELRQGNRYGRCAIVPPYRLDCRTVMKPTVSLLRPNVRRLGLSMLPGQTGLIVRGEDPRLIPAGAFVWGASQ